MKSLLLFLGIAVDENKHSESTMNISIKDKKGYIKYTKDENTDLLEEHYILNGRK